jgi:hypothetical protein
VHIIDPGQQANKINPAAANAYPDDGVNACSHIELTDVGRPHIRNNCYTGGIDAHQAEGWVIRDNLIEGFWCENGLSEHGIHLWRGCRDTVVERNVLRENARGIGFGLAESSSGRTQPQPAKRPLNSRSHAPAWECRLWPSPPVQGYRLMVILGY